MGKRKRKKHRRERQCFSCDHCVYIGEGGYICDLTNDVVIDDWEPTEDFNSCKGRIDNEGEHK